MAPSINKEFVSLLVKCKCIIFDQHEMLKSCTRLTPHFAAAIQEIIKEVNWFVLNYTSKADDENNGSDGMGGSSLSIASTLQKWNKFTLSTAEILALESIETEGESGTSGELKSVANAKSGDYITDDIVKPFHCKQCPKKFGNFRRLKEHLLMHTGEKPYKCDVCNKTFRRQPTLASHKKIHTGEKPYQCKICRRRFRQHSTFRCHMRTHSGEKPLKCNFCERRFNNHSGKIAHVRSRHTGERPYLCDLCSASFISASMLKSHIRRHNNDKPYHCRFCPLRFVTNTGLRRHTRVHTGEKPFQCQFCHAQFRQKYNLRGHIQRIHNKPNNNVMF